MIVMRKSSFVNTTDIKLGVGATFVSWCANNMVKVLWPNSARVVKTCCLYES